MKKIVCLENLVNNEIDSNTLMIPLNRISAFYGFNLDFDILENEIRSNNIESLKLKVCQILSQYVNNKISGMITGHDFSYNKYEMAFLNKRLGDAMRKGKLGNDKNYQKFIEKSIDEGFVTRQEVEKMEWQINKRYDNLLQS